MTPRVRRLALSVHVATSVGWLGAVVGFLVVAVAALGMAEPARAVVTYGVLDLLGWQAILPLCAGSVVSGVLQGLGTEWGLLRHWWLVVKLAITAICTGLLLLHLGPLHELATADPVTFDAAQAHPVAVQLVVQTAAAIGALGFTTWLGVAKPRGLTRRGWRHLQVRRARA